MSLVICSNQYQENERTSNNNQAYSFKNNLGTQMKIPPNSEVAVQSVKINKDGSITLKPSDVFYIYQGDKIGESAGQIDEMDDGTAYPVRVRLNESKINITVTLDEFRSRIQTALNRGIINLAFNGQQVVLTKRDSDGAFEGFDLRFTQQNSSDTTSRIPTTAKPYYNNGGVVPFTYNASGKFQTKTQGVIGTIPENQRSGILTDSPLGNVGGKFVVTFDSGSSTGTQGTSWAVGLRRSRFVNDGKSKFTRRPLYFDRTGESFAIANQYYDYVVASIQEASGKNRFLRVYQASIKEDITHGDEAMSKDEPITMREIEYFGSHNADFKTARYNMSTNASGFTLVEFHLKGNQMHLSIGNASNSYNLVNPETLTGSVKKNIFKPLSLTTELLYPHLWIQKPSKSFTVTKYDGKSGYTFGDPKRDWWARMEQEGLTQRFCKRVDTRYWANIEDDDEFDTSLPVNGSFAEADFPVVVILGEDENYVNTTDANSELLLGFEKQHLLDSPSYTNPSYTFSSHSIPSLTARGSAFVRLNNFTQQSFNAGKGALSKILYHLPRFDNSGNEVGSDLFYESAEKTYVALNNPNELNINSFDIDIVTEQEVFATDLVGKTIVVLHFREKTHKM